MNLSAPKTITFWISVVLAVLGLVAQLGILGAGFVTYGFWLVLVGFVLLAFGNLLTGL